MKDMLLALHDSVPGLTLRNVLEILVLLADEKPVVRLVLRYEDVRSVRSVLEGLDVAVEVSQWALRTAYSTSLGDTYTTRAALGEDSSGERVVMAAKCRERAQRALASEEDDLANDEVGRLLGYPSCCVEAYGAISQTADWLANALMRTPLDAVCLAGSNRVSTLFSEEWIGFDYFPCSLACVETAKIAATVARVGTCAGLGELVRRAETAMAAPILVRNGIVLQLLGWNHVGDGVRSPLTGARLHGWRIAENADEDPVWDADTVEASRRQVRFLKQGRTQVVAATSRMDNRLLVFA